MQENIGGYMLSLFWYSQGPEPPFHPKKRRKMNERRTDIDTRTRIARIQSKYTRFARVVFWILALQFVNLLIFGLLGGWFINENRHRANESIDLSKAIQDQRKESFLTSCRDQNLRNTNTIKVISDRIKVLYPDGKIPSQVQQSVNYAILLINALAPRRNCEVAAKQLTKTPGEVPKNANSKET